MTRLILSMLSASLITACASGGTRSETAAGSIDPFTIATRVQGTGGVSDTDYRIGQGDLLRINVFQVPELSVSDGRVDSAGNVQLPLIGPMQASGRSATELATEIESALGLRYLENPRVSVTVAEAASQKVTIDGAVNKPGVYQMRGTTTLLQAVAMAEGPTRVADLRNVAVFRTVDNGRMVAVFDLAAIRAGRAEDPRVSGDDIVIVDTSRLSLAFRDVVAALPAVAAFAYF